MKISIKTTIVLNFTILIALIVSLLISLQYYSNQKLALSAADRTFNQVTNSVVKFTEHSEGYLKQTLDLLSLNKEFQAPISANKHPILENLLHVMKNAPAVQGVYITHPNGDFYELVNLANNPQQIELYSAPKTSKWLTITILSSLKPQQKQLTFMDEHLEITKTLYVPSNFLISSRPWYKRALHSDEVILTKHYIFDSTQTLGLTYAKKIPKTEMVISLDFTIENLNKFLSSQNFDTKSYILLYDNDGQIIASSREEKPYNWSGLFRFFQESKGRKIHEYKEVQTDYFVYHSSVDLSLENALHIAIIANKWSLLQPYMQLITDSLYIALIFMLLIIPFILFSGSLIAKPITALMSENKKIVNRKFNEVKLIKTHISELHALSNSFVSMSKSIGEYQKAQEDMLDSIVKLIAQAIDSKSTYTGGHCRRVPKIAQMLTQEAHNTQDGPFKEFSFKNEDEWREFFLGAWLHDCGKVTTPEYVVDKSTKLETIYNRIHEIRTRFEVLWRDVQIEYLESQLSHQDKQLSLEKLQKTQNELIDEFSFIATSNMGGEFISEVDKKRIRKIAQRTWVRHFNDRLGLSDVELLRYDALGASSLPVTESLLSDKKEHIVKRENFDYEQYKKDGFKVEVPEHLYNYGEVYNLTLAKGTLTDEERFKINEHVIMTIKILEQIPFPSHLTKIPEYAGTHHETMIGTGYPRKLKKEELSIPARIMAIADIFEALSASDRPYKKAKTVNESLKIMTIMVKEQHIDEDLFKLFVSSGVYMKYAQAYLKPEQIDEVDISILDYSKEPSS